jgi:hypothetical protein
MKSGAMRLFRKAINGALERAGKEIAMVYIGFLGLVVLIFPFLFLGGLIFLGGFMADLGINIAAFVGIGHLHIISLVLSVGFCLFAPLFISIYAWPCISPTVDRVLGELQRGDEAGSCTKWTS